MLSIPFNPNVVTLSLLNGRFESVLPARLVGLITQEEFSASIYRCNLAVQKGNLILARLFVLVGVIVWGVCMAIAFSSSGFQGPNITLIVIGAAAITLCSVIGAIWTRSIIAGRISGLQEAVANEHNYYSSPARAQQRPGQPPISWSTTALTFVGYRRQISTYCQINIEIGGGYAQVVMMPPGAIPHGQPQPYYQSPPPVYSYQQSPAQPPQSFPSQSSFAIPTPGATAQTPLLEGQSTGETSEGQAHSFAHPLPTCACGRVANNVHDKFCANCGGPFRR